MKNNIKKILNNDFLIIIKNGFIGISGITIVSSFFTLIANFPVQEINDFCKLHFGSIWTVLIPNIANSFYYFISLYIIISISYQSAKHFKIPKMVTALTTLMSYFIFLPLDNIDGSIYLNINSVNSNGIFLAIVLGIMIPFFLKYTYEKNFVIKISDNVPEDVINSFNSIFPTLIILVLCFILNVILMTLGINNLPKLIYKLIQIPILGLGNNIISIAVMNIGIAILWFFGFNGTYIFNTVMIPILSTLSLENLTAISKGHMPPNIITSTFQSVYTNFGGCGSTLALVIGIFLVSKSESLRKIAKLSLIPSIFNINETIVYGLPIIMNTTLFIPFIICPIINALIAYFSIFLGFVGYTNGIQLPWTTPIFISGFLSTGGSGVVLQFVLIIIDILIYVPFIIKLDKKMINNL